MIHSPISFTRRHVLGDLYTRCANLGESVPVYLAGESPELLGHADEGLGHYADAYSFHLTDEFCKKLSSGHFTYSFDYEYADPKATGSRSSIKLTAITLNPRKAYEKPISKRAVVEAAA